MSVSYKELVPNFHVVGMKFLNFVEVISDPQNKPPEHFYIKKINFSIFKDILVITHQDILKVNIKVKFKVNMVNILHMVQLDIHLLPEYLPIWDNIPCLPKLLYQQG